MRTVNGANNTKKNKASRSPVTIDFGNRTVSRQNFSRIVALPKEALDNCGIAEKQKVNVRLVEEKGRRFIKLTPACTAKGEPNE